MMDGWLTFVCPFGAPKTCDQCKSIECAGEEQELHTCNDERITTEKVHDIAKMARLPAFVAPEVKKTPSEDGANVGPPVGRILGDEVDGDMLGSVLGISLGLVLGDALGLVLGDALGLGVGILLG
jgi:hypothetical protein